jgi:ADP-heptose:LPS heptosyltransferase
VDAVTNGMDVPAVNLAGRTSVDELMPLLAGAAVVVAGDTGPLHLAAALGAPTVGIYGPTDPVNTGPCGTRTAVVRLGLSCSPCYDLRSPADCKLPDRSVACMWGISPERVFEAVAALLDERDAAVPSGQ